MVKNFFLIMLLSFFFFFFISFRSRRTLQALRSLEFCIKKSVNSCLYLRFAKTFNANKIAHGITVSISDFLRIKD